MVTGFPCRQVDIIDSKSSFVSSPPPACLPPTSAESALQHLYADPFILTLSFSSTFKCNGQISLEDRSVVEIVSSVLGSGAASITRNSSLTIVPAGTADALFAPRLKVLGGVLRVVPKGRILFSRSVQIFSGGTALLEGDNGGAVAFQSSVCRSAFASVVAWRRHMI